MSGAKAVCAKHERAYVVADGCPYCEVVVSAPDAFAAMASAVEQLVWWPTTPQHVGCDDDDSD